MLRRMTSPEPKTALLLDSAVDLLFEVHLMRGDCCVAARAFAAEPHPDEAAIEECARLEESLAKVYRTLQHTLKQVRRSRAKGREPAE